MPNARRWSLRRPGGVCRRSWRRVAPDRGPAHARPRSRPGPAPGGTGAAASEVAQGPRGAGGLPATHHVQPRRRRLAEPGPPPEVLGLPTEAAVADHASRLDLRLTLIAALELLTPRQRAAVVARYWEQLSEAETAAALGCSVSAVKAAAARGLKTLRQAITPDMEYAPKLSMEDAGL